MDIKSRTANLLLESKASLGEGPLWIEESNELLWVDINKGEVHATNINTKQDAVIYKGNKVSCIVPASDGAFIVADTNRLIKLYRDTKISNEINEIKFKTSNIRFNDGKVDPNGNLWLGTMDMDIAPNMGSLYRIDSNGGVKTMVNNVTISNGLAWTKDNNTMYYIDTYDRTIYAFDFNINSEISNKRVAIKVPDTLGYPDGMTIDSNGNIWVAMWGGFAVICWNPTSGYILEKIDLPVPNITSCAFGGKNMDTLFITSARDGLSDDELQKHPLSGSVFYSKTDVNGLKEKSFS